MVGTDVNDHSWGKDGGKLTQVFATLCLLLIGAAGGALAGFSSAGAAARWDEETGKGGGRSSSLISL